MDEKLDLSSEEIKAVKDFLNIGRALVSSVTSSQITALAGQFGQILERVNRPGLDNLIQALAECSDSLAGVIRLVDLYYRSGTIKNGLEMIALLATLKDALSTQAVSRMAEDTNRALLVADQVTSAFGGLAGIERVTRSLIQSATETEQDNRTIGTLALLRSLKEPQVQKGIKFFLRLAEKLDEDAGRV